MTSRSLRHFDVSRTIDERIDSLIREMTVEEKASQLVDCAAAIPELGIPAYNWMSEALHGVASAGTATVFPQAIGLAATFDVQMMKRVANAIGREGRAKHREAIERGEGAQRFKGLNFYSPNINIFRDPRWGRGQETYGEDPYLTARMGVAFIQGLQGDDPQHLQVGATAKHYAVHSGPERGRHSFDAQVSMHDLEDTYLPAFRAAVLEAQVVAVMAAYNRVNGTPACAHRFLLQQRLRQDWNFDGQIVSDCDGVRLMAEQHHWVPTEELAYAEAIKAGMTSILDFVRGDDPSSIIEAVNDGLLDESDLDTALRPNLRILFRLGMFDPPDIVPFSSIPVTDNDSAEHRELAFRCACKSLVLLKNNGALPLKGHIGRIAVVGPLADNLRVLIGSYHGTPSKSTTLLEGLRAQFPKTQIEHEPGMSFLAEPVEVPADVLRANGEVRGLRADFFAGAEAKGDPIFSRVDPVLDYDGTLRTRPEVVPHNSAVRWSGFIIPQFTSEYEFGVAGNSMRLLLDGELIVDDSGPHAPRRALARVRLEAGRRYRICVELLPGFEQHAKLIWLPVSDEALDRARSLAADADVIIAAVGLTAELENEEIKCDLPGFEGGDRLTIDLPTPELDLLKEMHSTGKPLIVTLMSGGPLSVPWALEHADALLQCWYPGEEGGAAIAATLSGQSNPAGRLPVTIYKTVDDLPAFADYRMERRTYRYFDGDPLLQFGFGLSYSEFSYSDADRVDPIIQAGEALALNVSVTNLGPLDGDEVIQIYLEFPDGSAGAPNIALRAFERVGLEAYSTKQVTLVLGDRQLSHVSPTGVHRITPGVYRAWIGGGQPGGSTRGIWRKFTVVGSLELSH